MLTANPDLLDNTTPHAKRARFDYVHETHTIEDIKNDYYFGWIANRFKRRDIINVTDAREDTYVLIVDDVYPNEKRVALSLVEKLVLTPITKPNSSDADPGITVRWKGARGDKWAVIDREGKVIEKGYETRSEAERRLANILEAKQKAA